MISWLIVYFISILLFVSLSLPLPLPLPLFNCIVIRQVSLQALAQAFCAIPTFAWQHHKDVITFKTARMAVMKNTAVSIPWCRLCYNLHLVLSFNKCSWWMRTNHWQTGTLELIAHKQNATTGALCERRHGVSLGCGKLRTPLTSKQRGYPTVLLT